MSKKTITANVVSSKNIADHVLKTDKIGGGLKKAEPKPQASEPPKRRGVHYH